MNKLTLIVLLLLYSSLAYAQQNSLVFKKGVKTITRFWQGSFIAFQLKNRQWQKGELMRIQNDSFYIRPMVVRYNLLRNDTLRFRIVGFALRDVYALPKKGVLVDHKDGAFHISRSGGHVHWYWIKSGWVFRAGAAGYAALNTTNGLIKNDFSVKDGKLAIAGGTFLFGVLLKYAYKPTLRIRGKYHLAQLNLSN